MTFNYNADAGRLYCRRLKEVRAVQVLPENERRLREFVGNGWFEDEFFVFAENGRVGRTHALIGSYIIYDGERFEIVEKDKFIREWETK